MDRQESDGENGRALPKGRQQLQVKPLNVFSYTERCRKFCRLKHRGEILLLIYRANQVNIFSR